MVDNNNDKKYIQKKLTEFKKQYHQNCNVIYMIKRLLSDEIQNNNKDDNKIMKYNKQLTNARQSVKLTQVMITFAKNRLKFLQKEEALQKNNLS
jgi:chaperonin GroEL (HSP60 family)